MATLEIPNPRPEGAPLSKNTRPYDPFQLVNLQFEGAGLPLLGVESEAQPAPADQIEPNPTNREVQQIEGQESEITISGLDRYLTKEGRAQRSKKKAGVIGYGGRKIAHPSETGNPTEKLGWIGIHKRYLSGPVRDNKTGKVTSYQPRRPEDEANLGFKLMTGGPAGNTLTPNKNLGPRPIPNLNRPTTWSEQITTRRLNKISRKRALADHNKRWLITSYGTSSEGQSLSRAESKHMRGIRSSIARSSRQSDRLAGKFNDIVFDAQRPYWVHETKKINQERSEHQPSVRHTATGEMKASSPVVTSWERGRANIESRLADRAGRQVADLEHLLAHPEEIKTRSKAARAEQVRLQKLAQEHYLKGNKARGRMYQERAGIADSRAEHLEELVDPDKIREEILEKRDEQIRLQRQAQERRLKRDKNTPVDVTGWASTAPEKNAEAPVAPIGHPDLHIVPSTPEEAKPEAATDDEPSDIKDLWEDIEQKVKQKFEVETGERTKTGESTVGAVKRIRQEYQDDLLKDTPEADRNSILAQFRELHKKAYEERLSERKND